MRYNNSLNNQDALDEQVQLNEYKEDRIAEKQSQAPFVRPISDPRMKSSQIVFPIFDPGHGSLSIGKRSPKDKNGYIFYEYEFNRTILKKMEKVLKLTGFKYHNVMPETQVGNELGLRIGRVKGAVEFLVPNGMVPVFISLHANAGPGEWTTASGIETWYKHGCSISYDLAHIFQRNQIVTTGWKNRGIKSKGGSKQFYVLRKNPIPAILLEMGFYNNKHQMQLLRQESIQKAFVDANVRALLEVNEYFMKKQFKDFKSIKNE